MADQKRYEHEARREGRSYAKEHSYAEWAWFQRWEAGEIDNSAPTLSGCLDFLWREYPLTMKEFDKACTGNRTPSSVI